MSSHFTSNRSDHPPSTLTRRKMLWRSTQTAVALSLAPTLAPLCAEPAKRRFRIGACDWSIGKMDDPTAFSLARQIGLDGVQVSMGTAANNMHLREAPVRSRFREAARAAGVAVASLAIGELNNVPYKSDLRTIDWVNGCIGVCQGLGIHVVLLA